MRATYDEKIEDYIRSLFQQYYTMSFDNYPVELERIERPDVHACKESGTPAAANRLFQGAGRSRPPRIRTMASRTRTWSTTTPGCVPG